MIIRSQNKEKIMHFENIMEICVGGFDENKVMAITKNDLDVLGEYSTKEKVIKVLDIIQEAYVGGTKMVISNDGVTCYPIPVVFQMPQDEEVEV